MSITSEAKKEVERLLQQKQKLQAIKYICDTFGTSLSESKILVEALEQEIDSAKVPSTQPGHSSQETFEQNSSTILSDDLKARVVKMLQENQKIVAIKVVKQELITGLKDALAFVEGVEKEINPNYRSVNVTGCFGNTFKVLSFVFGFIGLLFLGVAGIIYYSQSKSIKNSELISGIVVDFDTSNESGTAPVIEYSWNGEQKLYHGTTYSSPPAYEMNETIPIYVDRDNPDDIIVDTFSERWLLIIILGGIGAFFAIFASLFFFASGKF